MATLEEFAKIVKLTQEDKSSGKRMRQILATLRKYKVTKGMTPQKAIEVLEALGPTFVKIGQIASTRPDMLPKEYCDAFQQLHDEVSPMPFQTVLDCIDESYGKPWSDVFVAIDPKPLGSASIAQVHRAVLINGDVVAVKVRRPGIVQEMSEDIGLMKKILATAEFVTTEHDIEILNLDNLVEELERTTKSELDFRIELDNLIRFHAMIQDQDGVTSPIPYPRYSNDSVLVMEYVEGVPIDDKKALVAEGIDTDILANRLIQSYVKQVLDIGFFQADPHAGNLLVRNKEIVWIDLGMVGTLNGSERALIGRMFRAVVTSDPFLLMESVIGLAKQHGSPDYGKLYEQLSILLDKYGSAELSDIDMGAVFGEIVEVVRSQNLIMSQSVTLLVRGIVTIEGVMDYLSPTTNVMGILSQHVAQQTLDPTHMEKRAQELGSAMLVSAESMTKLPSQVSHTLSMLNKGELSLKGEMAVATSVLETFYAGVGRFSLALISAALFIGSSILCATNMEPKVLEVPVLGFIGFIGASVLGIYVIVAVLKSRHRMKNGQRPE